VSHHPPVSAFQMIGPGGLFQYWGRHEYAAQFQTNGILGQQLGPNYMFVYCHIHLFDHHARSIYLCAPITLVRDFADGTRVSFNMPFANVKGLLWGERTMAVCTGQLIIKLSVLVSTTCCRSVFAVDRNNHYVGRKAQPAVRK